MKPSMWCNKCQKWTKEYDTTGEHICGGEVDSAGVNKKPNDLYYEGNAIDED